MFIFFLFKYTNNVLCVYVCVCFFQLRQLQTVTNEDRAAMMEMVQTKAEELLRREEEGRTMRVLYESEVLISSGCAVISGSGAGGMSLLIVMKVLLAMGRRASFIGHFL